MAIDNSNRARTSAPGRDRLKSVVEGWFRFHTAAIYVFLFLPIVVVVVFSFNGTDRYLTDWNGLSLKWYQRALSDTQVQRDLWNSVSIGIINAILATAFGTMAALGLQRVPRRLRGFYDALTYVSIIIPEIVIALATLILFAGFQNTANQFFVSITAEGKPFRVALGQWSIILAHVLFNLSLVLLLVRARLSGMDRTLVDASYDLFATPWRTFRQITFPQLLPAIVAGFLLSFTFSFDDYVISSFVAGVGSQTLPLYIFGQTKQGVTPETNAVAAVMLVVTLTILGGGQFLLSRQSKRTGGGGGATTPIAMVAEQT
jgi:spermidine/putrescine transport system permease protein